MSHSHGDRGDDRNNAPGNVPKKPYEAPAWEEEEILEKTALACSKMPPLGCSVLPPPRS